MSNIKNDENGLNAHDIEEIGKKRIVFIVDECHRSTFGEMLSTIKSTFPNAIFFGFTGTPIFEENQKKMSQHLRYLAENFIDMYLRTESEIKMF